MKPKRKVRPKIIATQKEKMPAKMTYALQPSNWIPRFLPLYAKYPSEYLRVFYNARQEDSCEMRVTVYVMMRRRGSTAGDIALRIVNSPSSESFATTTTVLWLAIHKDLLLVTRPIAC
jgi:hypothetical protein